MLNNLLNNLEAKSPFVIILVGPPLCGKSFFSNKITDKFPKTKIICRDSIILELHGTNEYNKAFKEVNQKEVDRILLSKMSEYSKEGSNVILDMTHMSPKRRKHNLSFFPDYYKVALIFPFLSKEEWSIRNEKRKVEENKDISWGIVENMMSQYQVPVKEEGFNKIISI